MFAKLLSFVGKKFLLQLVMLVVAPLLALLKQKTGLEIEHSTIDKLVEMAMVGLAAQGVSDAVSKGATSSIEGTPTFGPDKVVADQSDKMPNSDVG